MSDQPTYTVMVGEQEIRLPKGPWKYNGQDTGSLSIAATQAKHNHEILLSIGIDESTIVDWEDRGILNSALD